MVYVETRVPRESGVTVAYYEHSVRDTMADADRPTTHLVKPAELKKGDYVMIKGNPCYITEITAKVKGTGERGEGLRTVWDVCAWPHTVA
jgi:uncharacterized Zn finger protein